MTTRTKDQVQNEIAELLAIEVCVEHNEGTYSAWEAGRMIGCGDPAFANRCVYETVGGTRRETGPSADKAPGYMRKAGYETLASYRRDLRKLREELN